MEYIISFENTSYAIKAEHHLLEQGLDIRVMPLPPQIRAGCGITLRVTADEIHKALKVLTENHIDGIELFSRIQENGKYTYKEIVDISILEQEE